MVDVGGSFDLLAIQEHFLLAFILDRVLRPGAKVHKEDFSLAVTQISAVIFAAFFVLVQNPKCNADVCGNEQLARQNDDGFNLVVLDKLLADFHSVTIAKSAVCKKKTCYALGCFQMREHVENPRIVRIAFGRRCVVLPARIVFQILIIPAFQIEWRICHDVIEIYALVKVMGECGIRLFSKIVADAAQGEVHFRKTVGCRLFLLTVNIDTADIAFLFLDQVCTLNEHAARTAAWIVECAVIRLNHGGNQLHRVMRRVELAFFLGGIDGKFLEEVFVHSSNQVFFLSKRLMAYLIDLVHNLLDVVGSEIAGCESTLDKASFQLFAVRCNAVQSRIKSNVESGRRRIDDGGPTGFHRKIIRTVRKGSVFEERRKDFLIIGI